MPFVEFLICHKMKTFITLIFLCLFYSAKAQLNQVGKSEDQIKTFMINRGGCCEKVTYTDAGVRMITYQFPMSESTGLLDAFFMMNKSNICFQCFFYYQNDDMVAPIVENAESNPEFKQEPNKLVFYNESKNYYIKITRKEDNHIIVCYSTINNK